MRAFKKTAADSTRISAPLSSSLLIRTKPSLILLWLVLFMHGCAGIAIMLAALPLIVQMVFTGAIAFLAWHYYRQWCNEARFHLQKNQNQQWVFCSDTDESNKLMIESCYYWSRYLVIFRVTNSQSHSFFYPVLVDSCDADSHRHLRVLAKFLL